LEPADFVQFCHGKLHIFCVTEFYTFSAENYVPYII